MSQPPRNSRGLDPIGKAANVFRMSGSTLLRLDPDVVRYDTGVSVWGRWFIWLVTVVQFVYRPGFWYYEGHPEYVSLLVPWAALNGLVHYRLLTNRSVSWRWLLLSSATDMVLITVGIILQRGLDDDDYDTNAIVMMGQTGETIQGVMR